MVVSGGGIERNIALNQVEQGADIINSDVNREASMKVESDAEKIDHKFCFE
ncbi:MAG: hypothetical protein AB2L12_08705 [Smithellaceae bacterium]